HHGEPAMRRRIYELGRDRPFELPEYFYADYQSRCIDAALEQGVSYYQALALNPFPAHAALRVAIQDLPRYAIYGWSHVEEQGMWSLGTHHVIRLRIMDFDLFPQC